MSNITADNIKVIQEWLSEHEEIFECDCKPYMESDTGAWIHNEEKCSSYMQDHIDVTLRAVFKHLTENGPIEFKW